MFFILPAINIKHVNAIECSDTIIEFDDNNCYYETMLETYSSKARSSTIRSGKKTTSYKNSSGEILWSVSVTGTFTSNGNAIFNNLLTANKVATFNDNVVIKKTLSVDGASTFNTLAFNSDVKNAELDALVILLIVIILSVLVKGDSTIPYFLPLASIVYI